MINWMLDVEDVEDVSCAVDNMKTSDRSPVFGGEGGQEYTERMMDGHCPRWRWRKAVETTR